MNSIHLIAQVTFFPVILNWIDYSTMSIPLTANTEKGFCFSHQIRNDWQPCQSFYGFWHRTDYLFTLYDFLHCGWAERQVTLRGMQQVELISFVLSLVEKDREVTTNVSVSSGKKRRGTGSPLNWQLLWGGRCKRRKTYRHFFHIDTNIGMHTIRSVDQHQIYLIKQRHNKSHWLKKSRSLKKSKQGRRFKF